MMCNILMNYKKKAYNMTSVYDEVSFVMMAGCQRSTVVATTKI